MKALVYTGPEALAYRDAADPIPDADQELIAIESVGICGSDMHAFLGHDARRPAPLILGHEVCGVTSDGTRVTVNPLVSCGTCRDCLAGRDNLCAQRMIISMPPREGGFAQKVAMRPANLVDVPDHVTPDQAALAEPIACGWHAVRLGQAASTIAPADARALVMGGGAIGLGAALCLKAQGYTQVTIVEPNDLRRAFLQERCDQHVVTPDKIGDQPAYDLVIDGVGIEPTRAQACAVTYPGSVIVHIGLGSAEGGLDVRRMTLQELTFIGTYTYTAQDFRDTCAAMFDGRLGPLDWTQARPLSQGAQAFADIRAGRAAAPKIILKPDHQET